MGLGGEFAQGTGAVAMEGRSVTRADAEIHDHPASADALDAVCHGQLAGVAEGFAETGIESVHHHVDVLVPLGIEIIDAEEVLKEGLLRAFQMKEITGVMEDAEGVEFIKINRSGMGVSRGHLKGTEERGGPYGAPDQAM